MRLQISFLLFALGGAAIASAAEKSKPLEVNKKQDAISVVVRQIAPFNVVAACSVELTVGSDSIVYLDLTNGTDKEVHLGNPETTPGCVSVKAEKASLSPGQSCLVMLTLRPDRDYADHLWSTLVAFPPPKDKRGGIPTLTISSKLRGVFVATPSLLVLLASHRASDANVFVKGEIDVVYSDPVNPKNFVFSGSDIINLLDIDIQKGDSEGKARIVVAAKSAEFPKLGTHGHLEIKDSKTGDLRVVDISMIRRAPLRLIPSTIVFRRISGSDELVASAILVRDSRDSKNDKTAKARPLPIEKKVESDVPVYFTASAKVAGVKAEVLQGATDFRRLRFSIDASDAAKWFAESESPALHWDAMWGDLRVGQNADVLLPFDRKLGSESDL